MKIKIALFASARELVGASSIELAINESATVADLKATLAKSHPGLTPLISKSVFSVDHEYATEQQILTDGSEVGLIPPVSGG
jgi:molybdopterin converting factor subunit 1